MNEIDRIENLQTYYALHGVLPSYQTIAKLSGYASKSSVFAFIDRLKSCDRIDMTPENRIKPGSKFWMTPNVELTGRTEAGEARSHADLRSG